MTLMVISGGQKDGDDNNEDGNEDDDILYTLRSTISVRCPDHMSVWTAGVISILFL